MNPSRAADPFNASLALRKLQDAPPSPLPRAVLLTFAALVLTLLVWAVFGKLDVVAVAEGKLVPASYLQIVQPAESGIVQRILVREGEHVQAGQVLMRMDPAVFDADRQALLADYHTKRLTLRRIDAQLAEAPLRPEAADPADIYREVAAQYRANRHAYESALSQEQSVREKARNDLAAATEVRAKLVQVLPHYREQEQAFKALGNKGFAGRIMVNDKARERIEKEQDLKTQDFVIQGAQATIGQSEKRLAQIGAEYRRSLQTERVEAATQHERLRQELAKLERRSDLLELRAPQDGIVKDLATHTPGTVVSPGTVVMTLVPNEEALVAEVWVRNDDVGFVHAAQPVKLKLVAFQFQKYGLLDATVKTVSADAAEASARAATQADGKRDASSPLLYKTLVQLAQPYLEANGERHRLAAGMQVAAEIKLGERTVLEYVLSPISKAWHEAARER